MLWVLKRTVSMISYVQTDELVKKLQFYSQKFCLSKPMSCKANGDRNQLEGWLDSDLRVE